MTLPHTWWRHKMETFSALIALCAGNSPVTDESHTQRPVTRNLMFSLICTWANGWINNSHSGDSRLNRTLYDVPALIWQMLPISACGASFNTPTGTITSPNYPSNYGNDMRCEYHITVEEGKVQYIPNMHTVLLCFALLWLCNRS